MGEKWFGKKQSPRSSWTLFFFRPFPPHVWDSVFFRPLKMISSLLSVPEIFQHQGSGNSFRGAKGSLYWSCPIQIPPKCWRWSNLVGMLLSISSMYMSLGPRRMMDAAVRALVPFTRMSLSSWPRPADSPRNSPRCWRGWSQS